MDTILIPSALIGILTVALVELFKLIPYLSMTDNRKRLVCFGSALGLTIGYMAMKHMLTWDDVDQGVAMLVLILSTSYALYKTLIQAVSEKIGEVAIRIYSAIRAKVD